MVKRDELLIKYINKHYNELLETLQYAKDFNMFTQKSILNKAIKLDLLQIGENINHLSDEAKLQLKKEDLSGVIAVRNQVAHGYVRVDDESIWDTINNDLPRLMSQVNSIR